MASDLIGADYVETAPGTGGSKLVVQVYTDSADSVEKTLPASAIYWGVKDGDYFLANETTPLPVAISTSVDVNLFDGTSNALISATSAPGSSDRGLVVRLAGTAAQGTAAAASGAWPTKISDGTDTATITTVSSKKCLDVNIASGAGNGSNLTDKGAFVTGTTDMTVVGGIYISSRDTLSDATGAAAAMTAKRAIYVSMETPSGDSVLNETFNSVVGSAAFPAATTATLTTTGPTASTACSGLGTVAVSLSGTCSSLTATFQVSSNGGTDWYDAKATRKDTNAADGGPSSLAMASENITWQVDTTGYTHFRMNVTELTTYGSIGYTAQACAFSFQAPPGSSGGGGGTSMVDDAPFTPGTTEIVPVGGTYRSSRDSVDSNDGGCLAMTAKRALFTSPESPTGDSIVDDTYDAMRVVSPDNSVANIVSASGTNSTAVKASAGVLCGYSFYNSTASPIYVRFYDASSVTVGTTTPKVGPLMIPAESGLNSPSTDMKVLFANKIQMAFTTGMANTDTTGLSANDICGTVLFR